MANIFSILVDAYEKMAVVPKEATTVIEAINAALDEEESRSFISKRFSPGGYVCSRFKAHERLNDFKPRMALNDADTLRVFKAGHSIHDTLQQSMLALTKNLFGTWECPSCGFKISNAKRPSATCNRSRLVEDIAGVRTEQPCAEVLRKEKIHWKYVEKYVYSNPLNDDLYAIAGKVDGLWVYDDGRWATVEVKSIDGNSFEGMSRVKNPEVAGQFILKPSPLRYPVDTHINQGMVYSKILLDECASGVLPLLADKFVGLILIYVDRESFDMKEFHIDYTPAPYNELLQLATLAKKAVEHKNAFLAPARCSSANTVLAKKCPLRFECFPKK